MVKTYSFKVLLEPDEDSDGRPAWFAYCPALKHIGGNASGRTKNEALKNLSEIVRMIIEELHEDGEPIPQSPSKYVRVDPVSQYAPRFAITV